MADEIKLSVQLSLTKGSLKDNFNPGQISLDQTNQGLLSTVVSVGTSEEDLSVGDISTLGILVLQNLGTNFVEYGPKSGGSMVAYGKIEPGEVAVLRLKPGITHRWVADTAAVKVLVKLLED